MLWVAMRFEQACVNFFGTFYFDIPAYIDTQFYSCYNALIYYECMMTEHVFNHVDLLTVTT